jgi:hypothetical protein
VRCNVCNAVFLLHVARSRHRKALKKIAEKYLYRSRPWRDAASAILVGRDFLVGSDAGIRLDLVFSRQKK